MRQEADLGMRDRIFYELARDLSSSLEVDVVLKRAMDRVISLMKASRGFILLPDATGTMSVQMSGGDVDPEKSKEFPGSLTVVEHVVRTGNAVVSTDASLDDRFKGQQSVIRQNLRSIIAVPLVTKGSVIGAVYVDNPYRASVFVEKDKEYLQAIADLAAIAIDNARQYERSEFLRDRIFYELARDLSSSLEVDVVLERVMDRVISLMKASRGFIVLVDATGSMSVQMSGGDADPEKSKEFLGSRTVIEHVVRTGNAVVSTDASLDDRFKSQQSVILQNLRSIIAVPLVTKGSVIGAVYVDNPFRASVFAEKDKEYLQAIADLAAIAIDNARQYERSEFLRQLFELYVNKQVTDYVLARSDRETKFLPGERRQVTMLNSDIAGFSALSQSMEAEELVRFLNDYFARMIDAVLEHGGNIDKFQGDGMLVVFGAPNPLIDHAQRALAAARAMLKEIDILNRELTDMGKPQIAVGMGLDTGEVVAGHVGSEKRLEFTLIGVPVNNCSYLSKVRPAKVLMSETTRNLLATDVEVIDYEPLVLKGMTAKQPIYQLTSNGQ